MVVLFRTDVAPLTCYCPMCTYLPRGEPLRALHGSDVVSATDFRIFIRSEGDHFVGLCAELRAIINGASVDEIVNKTKLLIARAVSAHVVGQPLVVDVSGLKRNE